MVQIFEEFLKHQAPKEMGMITGDARRGVLRDLRCPNSLMFASCRELALRGIATSGVRSALTYREPLSN